MQHEHAIGVCHPNSLSLCLLAAEMISNIEVMYVVVVIIVELFSSCNIIQQVQLRPFEI